MAKGNLFLGTAARSVGDVVMYRREGSQVSRVRVRKIANPKTEAQCRQRAHMNAVVKFYQPLANILDRSWEGLSRAKSYAKFLQTNVNLARKNNWVIAKDMDMFGFPFQLSEGSLGSMNTIAPHTDFVQIQLATPAGISSLPTNIGELSAWFVAAGWKNGDVVTIICGHSSTGYGAAPTSHQFIIDTTSTADVYDTIGASISPVSSVQNGTIAFEFSNSNIGDAIIISRNVDGEWKRTTSFFAPTAASLAQMTQPAKVAEMIASYGNNAGDVNPLVYLDGDELESANG